MTSQMQIFPWNKNFETGIVSIDVQHEQLVGLLNQLANHLVNQSGLTSINAIFDELTTYALYHFQTEEALWHEHMPNDSMETRHLQVHGDFVQAVTQLKSQENGKEFDRVIEDVLKFLTHWLVFHILEEDMRLAKVVLAVQAGASVEDAKTTADRAMRGAMRTLIDSLLTMYDSLAASSLELSREIINRQKAEARLRLASIAVDNTLDSICITDENAIILEVNPSFCETTQFKPHEVIGQDLKTIKSVFREESLARDIWNTVHSTDHWSGEISSHRQNGVLTSEWLTLSAVKNDAGEVSNFVAVFSDITQLIAKRHKTEHVAHHDALTGLPNRLLLGDRLRVAIAHPLLSQHCVAVCFLDLDGFKQVNDRLGHAAGDLLLQEVARRLLKVVRSEDTVARLGGDEFVLLLGHLRQPQEFTVLVERVLRELSQPIQIGNEQTHISASIGVTLFPQDNSAPDVLLQHADQAMYLAKQEGKATYRVYQPTAVRATK